MADKKVTTVDPKSETKAEVSTGGKETLADKKVTTVDPKSETKVATPKKKETKAEVSTNGGKETVKLQDLKPIQLSAEKFKGLDAKGLHAEMCTKPCNRISRERGKELLVERIGNGKINSITAEAIMDWTYKAVTIKGVTIDSQGFTPTTAKKTLTQAEFDEYDAQGKAALIKEYTHKRRASDIILPDLILKGMPLSDKDVVYLTNGRIEIKGVEYIAKARQVHAITEGVKFS